MAPDTRFVVNRTHVLEFGGLLALGLVGFGATRVYGQRINRASRRELAALEALSVREARLSALTDATTQVIWTVAPDGTLIQPGLRWSALTGIPPDQLDRTHWLPYVHPEDREPGNRAWLDGIASGRMIEFEQRVVRGDGVVRHYLVRAVPVRDASGAIREWVGVDIDITDRKTREMFEQDFVANVAHDIKNPLAAVKAQTQLLRRRLRSGRADPDSIDAVLAVIDGGLARMNRRIEELADVARLRAGQELELRTEPTDLVAIARGIAETYQQTTDRHRLVIEADDQALIGNWDVGRIDRVVDNLLSNAIKYSPNGGTIKLTLRRETADDEWTVLAVSDHGIGIPAADVPHIFERYRRAGNTTVITGTGIGLAGARQIVEQHGGRFEVQSVEGEGSTFTVYLPLAHA